MAKQISGYRNKNMAQDDDQRRDLFMKKNGWTPPKRKEKVKEAVK